MSKKCRIIVMLLATMLFLACAVASFAQQGQEKEWPSVYGQALQPNEGLHSSLHLQLPVLRQAERELALPWRPLWQTGETGCRVQAAVDLKHAARSAALVPEPWTGQDVASGSVAMQPHREMRLLLHAATARAQALASDEVASDVLTAALQYGGEGPAVAVMAWQAKSASVQNRPEEVLNLDRLMNTRGAAPGSLGAGARGLALGLHNISLLKHLTHDVSVAWFTGSELPPLHGDPAGLTSRDHVIEISVDHTYALYENLAALVEMTYMDGELDPAVWDEEKNLEAWKLAVGMAYRF